MEKILQNYMNGKYQRTLIKCRTVTGCCKCGFDSHLADHWRVNRKGLPEPPAKRVER